MVGRVTAGSGAPPPPPPPPPPASIVSRFPPTDVERPTAARAAHRHGSLRERCARVTLRADRVPRTPGRGQASRIHRTGNYPPSGRRMGGNLKRRPGHVDGTLIHV